MIVKREKKSKVEAVTGKKEFSTMIPVWEEKKVEDKNVEMQVKSARTQVKPYKPLLLILSGLLRHI